MDALYALGGLSAIVLMWKLNCWVDAALKEEKYGKP